MRIVLNFPMVAVGTGLGLVESLGSFILGY